MNLRTTILLAFLITVGGAAWYFYPKYAPVLGLAPRERNVAGAGSPTVLREQLTRDNLKRIEVNAGNESVVLEKGQGGAWSLPGNWPTRKGEADELVDLLTNLDTRFQVIAYDGPEFDRKPYGLDPQQDPVTVVLLTEKKEQIRLAFGEPVEEEGSLFAKPTYVQINDKPEIVRLGPDILPILKRPREYYQRRQLFPAVERVKFADTSPASPFSPPEPTAGPVVLPRASTITIEGPQGRLVLRSADKPATDGISQPIDVQQLVDIWQIVEPVRDRPSAERLKSLLAVIPNLWVESFNPPKTATLVAAALAAAPVECVLATMSWLAIAAQSNKLDWMLKQTGLENPERKISITPPGGEAVTLHIGHVSRVVERPGIQQPPPRPGMPPLPPLPVREEYRYASIAGQPTIFEVRADKFEDLFVSAASLRDERLARFQSKDVNQVEIKHKDGTIVLTRDKDEKWRVVQPMEALAENEKVNELLDKLVGLEARDADVIDQPNLKDAGLAPPAHTVTLTIEEEKTDGTEKKKQKRSVTFYFGKQDETAKKVNVQVVGRERVNLVDESAVKLVERPALAYRGRRVFDFEAVQVARIDVKRSAESYTLTHSGAEWKLTAPAQAAADKVKAGDLASDLGRLEAVEYVNDAPKPEDLANAGLDKPELSATITFTDTDKKPQTLLVGKQREGKSEYFAKLADGTSVFAIKKELRDRLDQNSLEFRPTQLWSIGSDTITVLKVERGGDGYELKREGTEWKVAKPFDASVGQEQVTPIVDALATLQLQGYQVHSAINLAEFGLDQPQLKITFTAPERAKDGSETPKERTLLIGKAVQGKLEVFAKLADDSAVFRISDALLANANKPALDLLDRRLLTLDSRRVSKIERGGSDKVTLTREGNNWKVQADNVSFTADGPTIDATLRAWESLQAEKFAAYGAAAKPEEFGLKPPADTITITLEAKDSAQPETHVLKLGKTADDGTRFAQIDDNPGIAVLGPVVTRQLVRGHLDYADRNLLQVEESAIQGLRRQMKGNDLEINRDGGWKIVKPSEHKADDAFMDNLASQLASLRAERVAAYSATDLKPYGLDNPVAVITVVMEKDGKPAPQMLKIGALVDAKAPTGERYVQVEGSKVVGVLARGDAQRLLAEPIAYRDRSLVRRLQEPDKVMLQRGERKATFVKTEGTWKLTEPVTAKAEHADLEEFVNALFKLRADELIAEKPPAEKLKEFGLDKPEATWKFLSGDKEVLTLIVGKPDSTGQRVHAKLDNSDVIFMLTPAVTARATAEYRKRTLWTSFDAAQADTLTLSGETGSLLLRKVEGMWQVEDKPEAKVNQEAVTELLGALANLKAERFVRDKDAPKDLYGLGKPRRTVTARTSTGQSVEIYLGNVEGGSQRVYAAVPGRTEVFVLSETDTAKLNRELLQKK